MFLIQFLNKYSKMKCGVVRRDQVWLLKKFETTYELCLYSEEHTIPLNDLIDRNLTNECENYDLLVKEKRILSPITHPDPYHTWVTGTGLTHLGSASSRDSMHKKFTNTNENELTDSMKMFKKGVENGKMRGEKPASQPEWFYKGNGLIIVNPYDDIISPKFSINDGDEAEIVAIYMINREGNPVRLGFSIGNEISDHAMEKLNYLYLAHSKLRNCSFGPEMMIGNLPDEVVGKISILRNKEIYWEKEYLTGENNMSHNLLNLEYHLFKYDLFRNPGDIHIHFLGTSVLSFSDSIKIIDGDVFKITANAFNKPLVNTFKKENG